MGTLFLTLGFFIRLNEEYMIQKIGDKTNMVKRDKKETKDVLDRYRITLGIFSIILGVLCIANYIIF